MKPRIMATAIPLFAHGKRILNMASNLVLPRASAPSRMSRPTAERASCEMLTIVGSAIIASIRDALRAFVPLDILTLKSSAAPQNTRAAAAHGNAARKIFFAEDFFFPKSFAAKNSPIKTDDTSAMGKPAIIEAIDIIAPPWFCSIGAKTTSAKKPYATDGTAASSSTTGLNF